MAQYISDEWKKLLKNTVDFRNVLNEFRSSKPRWMKNATRIALKAYRDISWEYDTRKLDKISTTTGAEWIRQGNQWILFRAESPDIRKETCVIELLDSLNHRLGRNPRPYDVRLIRALTSYIQFKFGVPEDIIEQTEAGKPEQCNDNNLIK